MLSTATVSSVSTTAILIRLRCHCQISKCWADSEVVSSCAASGRSSVPWKSRSVKRPGLCRIHLYFRTASISCSTWTISACRFAVSFPCTSWNISDFRIALSLCNLNLSFLPTSRFGRFKVTMCCDPTAPGAVSEQVSSDTLLFAEMSCADPTLRRAEFWYEWQLTLFLFPVQGRRCHRLRCRHVSRRDSR